jgi:hypothetical protein
MNTPRPYSQRVLRNGTILREFRADTRSEELVWHQDREHRSVRVIKSGGWMLQLEEGLPFPLVEGNTYEIPPRSWHRVVRGPGNLRIEIQEGNTMRITESQIRRIIREEIESEERNNIVSEIIDNTDPQYVEKTLSTRNPTGALQAGSVFDETQTAESLKSANWMPLNSPAIKSPAIAFTANIPGKLGIVPIERISDDTPVKFQLSHGGTGGKSGKAIEVVSNFDANLARVNTTTLIAGPDQTDPNKYVMWTFHPGDPSPLSAEITEDIVKQKFPDMRGTVADAKGLGFNFVKRVASLSEGILKRKITESQLRRIVREELALEAEKQAAPLKPIYVGVMLDEPGDLLEWWKSNVGDLLKNPIAHHMTIKFNPSAEEVKNMDIGRPVNLKVTGYANSDGIQAVVVEPDGVKSANSIPHITVATDGVTKPMMSNKVLAERGVTPVKGGPTLSGKIGFFASGKDWFDSSQLG